MRNRTISLLLALVLTMSAILPLHSLAAGKEDPLVLATKSDYLSSTNYSYDADGRLACRFNAYCLFHYKYWYNGALKQETEESRSQGILSTKEYNQWGDLVKVTEYQSDGTTRTQIGEPEYDEYGRLTSYTLTGWYDKNGKLENTYDEESWVYIYDDVRHADSEPLTITFGTWEQDGNTRNGQEPIEWQVLESDGEYLTLISKYALERRVFHQKKTDITWGDSTLRSWLNTSFLERAFTPEEQLQLMKGATELGVSDKVFLLSTQEAARYLRKNADRICMPTDDARRQGLSADKKTGSCSWLLRTTGNDKGTVVCVNADGSVNYQGVSVNSDKYGLRPCLRLPAYAAKGKFPLMETRYDFTTYDKKTGDAKSWVSEYVEYYGEKTPVTYCREYWDDRYEYKNSKDWEYSGEDNRYYDEYGNLISVHTIWQDGKDVDWFKANYEYTYNKAGQITQAIQYEDQINQANQYEAQVPRYLIQYKYDSAGRKISEVQKEYDDPSEVVCTKLWTYDNMGNLLTYRKDGELEAENTYDRYGNRLTFYMAGEICEAYYAENYGEIPPMKRWGYNEEKRTYAPLSELQWQGVSP